MTNYEQLKADIAAVVRANGIEAITGDRLQQVLTHMVDVLGNDYALAGVATPTTIPPTPDGNTAYIAGTSGTYTYFLDGNYNPLVVPSNCLTALLMYDASAEAWTAYPFGTIAQGTIGTNELADGAVTTPKIADSAVTTPKINDGAVSEAKLATAVQNKINNAVTLDGAQTITGSKEFTQPVALNGGAASDNDLDLEAADNVSIRANGGTMELSADDDMTINAHRLDINNPTGIDGNLSVIGDINATGDVDASGDIKATGKVYANINDELATKSYTDAELATKQDIIADLATIRAGAAAGATAYQKPTGGIPESDLSASVQTSLGKADTALQDIPDEAVTIAKIAPSAIDATPTENSGNLVTSGGVKSSIGNELITTYTNGVIDLRGGEGTVIPSPTIPAAGWGYINVPCDEGTVIIVSGNAYAYGLWAFVDSENKILSWSGSNVSGTRQVTAPSGTRRVITNSYIGNNRSLLLNLSYSVFKNIYDIYGSLSNFDYSYKEKKVTPSFIDGKYIYSSGVIVTLTGYEYGVFEAKAGDVIIVNVASNSGGCVIGVSKNSNPTKFDPVVISSGKTGYSYVCEYDCFIGISGTKISLSYKVISSRIDAELQNSGTTYATKRIASPAIAEDGKYRAAGGNIASQGAYAYTAPIFLKKGTFISNDIGAVSSTCSVISEVTENNGFIRSLYVGDEVAGVKGYVIDKTGYYSFSCKNNRIDYFVIVEFANGDLFFNNPLDNLFLNMESQTKPPREILRSPSFVGIVHKWGFIGDSLSSGEQAVYQDGSSTLQRFDLYDYSWGQRMCKLNSVEGYNFSAGGQTAKGWCTGAGDRVWAAAQLQENWKEAYCIALGVNDMSAPYPKGDASTDIDLSDYNNNADTFAGWYAGVIQRLRSVNPKCRIFCITIPYKNQQGYLDNNEIIRAIVPKFNRCYLVDLANYHWTPSELGLNDHLSPAGYQWAAWEINTYIDWIVRNNMDDFRDIAFVGTNYSADGNG